MTNLTQRKIVERLLLTEGEVSRNWALGERISRLGALMCSLAKDGWKFEASYVKKNGGKDYVYKLTNEPQPKQLKVYYVNNVRVGEKII